MKSIIFPFSLFFLLLVLQCFSSASGSALTDLCAKAWDEHKSEAYCLSLLRSDPRSEQASATELISIANHLAVQKIQSNGDKVKSLMSVNGYSSDQKTALDICDKYYKQALVKMDQVEERYQAGGAEMASNYVSSTMDKVISCVDAFVKLGDESLMKVENEEMVHMLHQVQSFIDSVPAPIPTPKH